MGRTRKVSARENLLISHDLEANSRWASVFWARSRRTYGAGQSWKKDANSSLKNANLNVEPRGWLTSTGEAADRPVRFVLTSTAMIHSEIRQTSDRSGRFVVKYDFKRQPVTFTTIVTAKVIFRRNDYEYRLKKKKNWFTAPDWRNSMENLRSGGTAWVSGQCNGRRSPSLSKIATKRPASPMTVTSE